MVFSTEYLQPFTLWLHQHPQWSLLLAFFISFAESLAVIGSIVPGSVMMTMVGILAGSGVMRIDLTLIAAVLGAIAGDGGSYLLGYVLSDRLMLTWPFKHHPQWLDYGNAYFERHGGKSIFFGRFVGPLRSIIPVIAGMMRMPRLEFFIANSISAVAWSIVYVGPGILIGAASTELSPESATRLFLLVLGVLAIIWASSRALKWLWKRIHELLRHGLHHGWCKLQTIRVANRITHALTPLTEKNHAATAGLFVLFLFFLTLSLTLFSWMLSGDSLVHVDEPIYFFLQSLRTHAFDMFFIIISFFITPYPLIIFITSLAIFAMYKRDWRSLRYWINLSFMCNLITLCFNAYIEPPPVDHTLLQSTTPLFPASELTQATACFGFLMFTMHARSQATLVRVLRFFFVSLLTLAGIALLYLGDNWITGVLTAYAMGLTLCLIHWLFYRRRNKQTTFKAFVITLSFGLLTCTAVAMIYYRYKSTVREHAPCLQQYVLSHETWWNQQKPLLPLYTTNRLGRPVGLFNIQYLGSIQTLQHALEIHGWHQESSSLLQTLLRASGASLSKHAPLRSQFYLSQKPTLTMTYGIRSNKPSLVLNVWRSNYHLLHHKQPLWIGSIQAYRASKPKAVTQQLFNASSLLAALHDFNVHVLPFPIKSLQPSNTLDNPQLFVIQEKND